MNAASSQRRNGSPLRILHIIDSMQVGGAQTHLVTLIEAMTRLDAGSEHHLLVLGKLADSFETRLRACNVALTRFDATQAIRTKRFDRVARAISSAIYRTRPDVVEAHLSWSRLLALPLAKALGVPLRIGFEQGDLYMRSPSLRVANHLHQYAAHAIVVCSQWLADWAHRTHGLHRERLWVMRNCVDSTRFEGLNGHGLARIAAFRGQLPPKTPIAISAGTLGEGVHKRVDFLVDGVATMKSMGRPIGLIHCGDGPLAPQLRERAEQLGVRDEILWLGTVDDMPAAFSDADFFVHAAPTEPFGIVSLEAQAMGLPVIVPDGGGIAESMRPGQTGMRYKALNPADFCEALKEMAQLSEDDRSQMGEAGRRFVMQHYDARAYAQHLLSGYEALLERPKDRPASFPF